MLVCHNTLSISYSTPYSPVSYGKHNSSHPKDLFHAWILLHAVYKCALSSFMLWHLSIWTQCASTVLISGKVIRMVRARISSPRAFSFPLFVQCTKSSHHPPEPIISQEVGLSMQNTGNQLINYALISGDSLPVFHPSISYITLQLDYITKHNLPVTAVTVAARLNYADFVIKTHCAVCKMEILSVC